MLYCIVLYYYFIIIIIYILILLYYYIMSLYSYYIIFYYFIIRGNRVLGSRWMWWGRLRASRRGWGAATAGTSFCGGVSCTVFWRTSAFLGAARWTWTRSMSCKLALHSQMPVNIIGCQRNFCCQLTARRGVPEWPFCDCEFCLTRYCESRPTRSERYPYGWRNSPRIW